MEYLEKYDCHINDEIDGACEYAEMAMEVKEQHPDLVRIFKEMAEQELGHAEYLHTIAEEMIRDDDSALIYSYLHKRHKERIAKVKVMIEML